MVHDHIENHAGIFAVVWSEKNFSLSENGGRVCEVINGAVHHNAFGNRGREIRQGNALYMVGDEVANSYLGIWASKKQVSKEVHRKVEVYCDGFRFCK